MRWLCRFGCALLALGIGMARARAVLIPIAPLAAVALRRAALFLEFARADYFRGTRTIANRSPRRSIRTERSGIRARSTLIADRAHVARRDRVRSTVSAFADAMAVTRYSSPPISAFPFDPVRLVCETCGRRGHYRKQTLIERHGPDIVWPDSLAALANCPTDAPPRRRADAPRRRKVFGAGDVSQKRVD